MNENRDIPRLQIGIISGAEVAFTLKGSFLENGLQPLPEGRWSASLKENQMILSKDKTSRKIESGIILSPVSEEDSSFTLHAVTIGVDFHWQRREDQVFRGALKLIADNGRITAVNVLSLEEYLKSVISSEMSATSSEDLLKAHSVISRGWIMAQIAKRMALDRGEKKYNPDFRTDDEIIKWYDREDHKSFDVCADDHCQRYQGITRASTPVVSRAVEETSGEVLMYNGDICDTRYYKCCGGLTELFENVWEPVSHPYLCRVIDNPEMPEGFRLDLTDEMNARRWIMGNPDAFCNTGSRKILAQVLNDYDRETNDFYRWQVKYRQDELSRLVKEKTGIDFGIINDLIPVERGVSGRIIRLKITGTLRTMTIGKELEIRKTLSKSHLYSSCFIVDKVTGGDEMTFVLHGAGWGHGVGLCQIGAAVMGSMGYTYREILQHYFPGSAIVKKY